MADQQPLNATFFAFKKRDRGGVLMGLSIAYIAISILMAGAFFLLNAQGVMDYITWATTMGERMQDVDPSSPAAMEAMMPPASVMALGPAYLLALFVFYVLFAAYEAGCLRWMIHGESKGFFGLSLGADTWRVYFGYWIWFLLLIALYVVFAVLIGGMAVAFMSVAPTTGDGGNAGGAMALIAPLLVVAVLVGVVVLAVRFAPAAATSVARRRFSFFDAWTVSKGRFWGLFGAFVLLLLMFIVFYIVFAGVFGFATASMMISQVGYSGEPQSAQEAFQAFANPQFLAMIGGLCLVMLIVSLLLYVAMFGVNARAALAAIDEGKIRSAE